MLRNGVKTRLFLPLVGGAILVAMLAPAVAARDTWTTKTLTPSANTSGCPSSLTVSVSWDRKGGNIAFVQFHLWKWDGSWGLVDDATMVTPGTRQSASYTFNLTASATYTFTSSVWKDDNTTLGVYDGMAANSTYSC